MGQFRRDFEQVYRAVRNDVFAFCRLMNFEPDDPQAKILRAVQAGTLAPPPPEGQIDPLRQIACASGQGLGKCLTANTRIFSPSLGRLEQLEDLAKRGAGFSVVAMDERTGRLHEADARAFASGKKPCVRVTVDSGQEVELSTDHPIFTPKGWANASTLEPDQLVAMPRSLPGPSNPMEIPEEELVFYALMLADGGCTANKVMYSKQEGELLDWWKEAVKQLGLSWKYQGRYDYRVTGGAMPLAKKWGLDKLSKHKRLHPDVFGLSDDQLSTLIWLFWSSDGYVNKDTIEVCLASKGLIKDLQTALLRFGIHSRIKYKLAKCQTGEFDSWRLTVSGATNMRLFRERVGFLLGREMPEIKSENTNTDVVPVKVEEGREIAAELGEKLAYLRANDCRPRDYAYLSRAKFARFVNFSGYNGKHAWLANSDLYWVKVKSVEHTGAQPVFDLEVPEYGNFVSENIVVHNTATTAVAMLWRTLQGVGARSYVTAPTMEQCKGVWFGELRNRLSVAHPIMRQLVKVDTARATIAGVRNWSITARTATKPENLQGLHHPLMTILIEEASGVDRPIIETIEGTSSQPENMIIAIGNPNTRSCAFYDFFTSQREYWTSFRLSSLDSIHYSKEKAARLKEIFGENSDVYRVRVLGMFPHADPNCVVSLEDLEACTETDPVELSMVSDRKQFGIDLARFGGDECVVFQRKGGAVIDWQTWSHVEPSVPIEWSFRQQIDWGWHDEEAWFVPDASGIGQGVLHIFHDAGKKMHPFHSHGTPAKPREFADKMTEAWFQFARKVSDRKIHLPNDPRLLRQLSSRQYQLDPKGRIKIESKKDYVKRTESESPDRADALVMAFYDQVEVSARVTQRKGGETVGTSVRVSSRR